MRIRDLHVLAGLCITVGTGGLLAQGPDGGAPAEPLVLVAEVDSIIHPVSAEYMIETHGPRRPDGAALVVFTLRTPGGLVDSTRDIVTHMLAAKTPVAIFVGPSGARAASAGFLLTIAADVAAMAPGTHIGAAHPVAGGGAADGRDDGEEGGGGRGRVRAHARRRSAIATSRSRRGGERQPRLHRGGGVSGRRRRSSICSRRTCPTCCASSTAGRDAVRRPTVVAPDRAARASCPSR